MMNCDPLFHIVTLEDLKDDFRSLFSPEPQPTLTESDEEFIRNERNKIRLMLETGTLRKTA